MKKKRRYRQGIFRPVNIHKYAGKLTEITYRSSWEFKFMNWCDLNPSVLKWNSEGIIIPYYSEADQKDRRYFVDFLVRIKDSEGNERNLIVEIKPESQTMPPIKGNKKEPRWLEECYTWQVNQDKWKHAKEWASKNNCEFVILNEFDLGISRRK